MGADPFPVAGGGYDQRRVLAAVSAKSSLGDAVGIEAIRAVGVISSPYDRSTALIEIIERGGLTDASAQAFFESASGIGSSHDLSRVLRQAIAHPSSSNDRIVESVLRMAPQIGGSRDRATVLIAVATRGRLSAEGRR